MFALPLYHYASIMVYDSLSATPDEGQLYYRHDNPNVPYSLNFSAVDAGIARNISIVGIHWGDLEVNALTNYTNAIPNITDWRYDVVLYREFLDDNELSDLSVSADCRPAFQPTITTYDCSVPYATTDVVISATAKRSDASVEYPDGTTIALPVNVPTFVRVWVNTYNNEQYEYDLTITRARNDMSDLSNLAVVVDSNTFSEPTCELEPAFDPAITEYLCVLGSSITQVSLNYSLADADQYVNIGGTTGLLPGENLIEIVVTAADLVAAKSYLITALLSDDNAYLADLELPGCSFTSGEFTGYTATHYCDSITSYTIGTDLTSSLVYVPSSAQASVSLTIFPVRSGLNQISIVVTASNEKTRRVYSLFFMNNFDEIDDCDTVEPVCSDTCNDELWTYSCS
jgi:hypothetical protein